MLLLIGQQVFQIVSLLSQSAPSRIVRKHAIILGGGNTLWRLLAEAVLESQLGLVLALAAHLVGPARRHHLNLPIELLLITLLH